MEEIWRQHPCGFAVSNFGRVRGNSGDLIPQRMEEDGSKYVYADKLYYVHVLVAETFLEPSKQWHCVGHIDGDKTNNHVDNLCWVSSLSALEQMGDSHVVRAYSEDKKLLCVFSSPSRVQQLVGVGSGAVTKCCRRQYGKSASVRNVVWRFANDDEFYSDGMQPTSTVVEMVHLCGTAGELKERGSHRVSAYKYKDGDAKIFCAELETVADRCHCSIDDILSCCMRQRKEVNGFVFRLWCDDEYRTLGCLKRVKQFEDMAPVGVYL